LIESAMEDSYEFNAGDSGDIVEELDESVADADESDREHEIGDIALDDDAASASQQDDVDGEIDYGDFGEETPPGSIAADELDIEIEGASLDDNDFALDDNVF